MKLDIVFFHFIHRIAGLTSKILYRRRKDAIFDVVNIKIRCSFCVGIEGETEAVLEKKGKLITWF